MTTTKQGKPCRRQNRRRTARRLRRRFPLGRVVLTLLASKVLTAEEIDAALSRHARGDWGAVSRAAAQENDRALTQRLSLFSSYHSARGMKFWIITAADRSSTTVLLPEES